MRAREMRRGPEEGGKSEVCPGGGSGTGRGLPGRWVDRERAGAPRLWPWRPRLPEYEYGRGPAGRVLREKRARVAICRNRRFGHYIEILIDSLTVLRTLRS